MIDKLKVFEVAWKEFVEWMKTQGIIWDDTLQILVLESDEINFVAVSDRELHSLCIEWLDSRGIYISTAPTLGGFWWLINQKQNREEQLFKEGYASRPEATEAGIIRAFEILNQRGEK